MANETNIITYHLTQIGLPETILQLQKTSCVSVRNFSSEIPNTDISIDKLQIKNAKYLKVLKLV